jgi:hypothetical protein
LFQKRALRLIRRLTFRATMMLKKIAGATKAVEALRIALRNSPRMGLNHIETRGCKRLEIPGLPRRKHPCRPGGFGARHWGVRVGR